MKEKRGSGVAEVLLSTVTAGWGKGAKQKLATESRGTFSRVVFFRVEFSYSLSTCAENRVSIKHDNIRVNTHDYTVSVICINI